MLPHLLEILLVGQEAIQSYYPLVQIILILNGSPLVIKQWGFIASMNSVMEATVTLPIPFSSNKFSIVGIGVAPDVEDHYNDYIKSFSAKSFVWRGRGERRAFWFAGGSV